MERKYRNIADVDIIIKHYVPTTIIELSHQQARILVGHDRTRVSVILIDFIGIAIILCFS